MEQAAAYAPVEQILDIPLPQLVEQLVEVPTVVSYSSLQRTMEQRVVIPVPGRGGRTSGLQGFPPGQSPTALHSPEERISEGQIVDIPSGGLQEFRPGQSSSSSSHFPARVHEGLDEPGEGVFRTFPKIKKLRRPQPSRVSSWTLDSADEPATQQDEDEELLFEEEEDPSGWFVSIAASGRPFHWHRSSRRSLWHLPPAASSQRGR